MTWVFRAGRWAAAVARGVARRCGVRMEPVEWVKTSGPHFGNAVMTLDVTGRDAVAVLEQAEDGGLRAVPRCRCRVSNLREQR
jgi:hypothetical protein